jgi:hypothetical protein
MNKLYLSSLELCLWNKCPCLSTLRAFLGTGLVRAVSGDGPERLGASTSMVKLSGNISSLE